MSFEVLYRDEQLCAIDKPCGLMVHRSSRSTDDRFIMGMLRDQLGQRVWPVHRLDRATSGVLLFALDPDSAGALGEQMMARSVAKRYLAVVRGHIEEAGRIDHPLKAEGKGPEQEAVTEYRRLATMELAIPIGRYPTARYSLVEARPETGRMHQLRRHFKHRFHPIIGDTTYGEGRHNRLFRIEFASHRMLLHASQLSFEHPADGRAMQIDCPPTGVFADLIERFEPDRNPEP
ncbi:pseudouridine synthase [Wenzhouxiangella marina]|uniref:tRNA pseudouridine synthase C n=1 Tax=Wenzhouxiangella marina TaxID=1579979 RepID=A0A0K0XYI2_9GAMM|nr:pseudouridine synthase [Wenzhouxiangella marina]AKS42691.1 Pseudouridine synthase [Wenzhouxiangella marina]MBB6088620.1 tRNA pseudouridine65 synthase [Wenzhouxiangella marina]